MLNTITIMHLTEGTGYCSPKSNSDEYYILRRILLGKYLPIFADCKKWAQHYNIHNVSAVVALQLGRVHIFSNLTAKEKQYEKDDYKVLLGCFRL